MKKYKIIKTYPGSDKLGTVITLDKNGECWSTPQLVIESDCKNNPEFFEEIIQKDYEILSFICNKDLDSSIIPIGTIIKKLNSGNFGIGIIRDSEEKLLTLSHWGIDSIKRLSDNEVFSIGDKCTNGIITGFKLDSNGVPYNGGIGVCFHTEERTITEGLKRCEKAKPVLFVTEDGKEIKTGDEYWYVVASDSAAIPWRWKALHDVANWTHNTEVKKPPLGYHQFSSEAKAQEWIILNKPVLSLKDVASIYPGINKEHNSPSHQAEQLKELVKSRL